MYENMLKEMREMYEKKINMLNSNSDDELKRLRDEMNKLRSSMQQQFDAMRNSLLQKLKDESKSHTVERNDLTSKLNATNNEILNLKTLLNDRNFQIVKLEMEFKKN